MRISKPGEWLCICTLRDALSVRSSRAQPGRSLPTFLRSTPHWGWAPAAPLPRGHGRARHNAARAEASFPPRQHRARPHPRCSVLFPSIALFRVLRRAPPFPGGGGAAHLRPSPRRWGGGAARARGGAGSTPLAPAGARASPRRALRAAAAPAWRARSSPRSWRTPCCCC